MHPGIQILSLLLLVFLAACSGSPGGKSQEYGKIYGSPQAEVGTVLPTGTQYFSGPGLSLLPEVKPLDASPVKEIRLDSTHKVIELADGVKYKGWSSGNEIPGPTVHVRQGDKVVFTLTNRSTEAVQFMPPMPHSIDFHAAMVSPQDKYRSIAPGQTLKFEWTANYPGVFMYHCGTPMVLQHMAAGMYGMAIVEPKDGYPTKADREYAVVQSEFYMKDK